MAGFDQWSATAASNASIGGVYWAEGMNASSVNNSAREMMADLAKVRDGTTPMSDAMTFGNAADTTKRFRFSAGSISAGTTRQVTLPDKSGTLAMTSDVPSLTAPFVAFNSLGGLTNGRILTAGAGVSLSLGATTVTVATNAATQAEQEDASAGNVFVTPANQQLHPSAPKFWVNFSSAGAITSSYNVTSVVRNSTGSYTVTIATDFSSVNWAAFVSLEQASQRWHARVESKAAGTVAIICWSDVDGAEVDPSSVSVMGYGGQA